MKVSSSAQPDLHGPQPARRSGDGESGRHRDTENNLFGVSGPPLATPKPSAKAAWLVAAIYLAAHLPFLAPSLEDIDSINFALGLRAFSPALHQPHPPGYPVYMVLGHASLAIVERVTSMSRVSAEAWSLAVWSAIGGAACIIAAWFLFAALAERAADALGVGSWKLEVDRIVREALRIETTQR